MSGPRRLYEPVPVRVEAGAAGRPLVVDGAPVVAVRESWLIEDRWWTGRPLSRRYWELVTDGGELIVVFRDLLSEGCWYRQRGTLS